MEGQSHPQFLAAEVHDLDEMKVEGQVLSKMKKNKKPFIISTIILITTLIAGLYGFTIFTKLEKMNSLSAEKKVLEVKRDDITSTINHHSTLLSLNSYAECYQTTDGLKGGSAFEVSYTSDYLNINEITKKTVVGIIKACTPRESELHIEGANDLVQSINQELESAHTKNESYVAEAKAITEDWKIFLQESDKVGGGLLNSEVYDRLRNLAAKALGVSPSTIGDKMNFTDLYEKVKSRLKALDDRQTKISSEKIDQFFQANAEGKTKEMIKSEVKEKSSEVKQLENDMSDLESRIQTKKSELFNPFK